MLTLKDLANLSDNDGLWEFLKADSLRSKVFDLVLDAAITLQPAQVDKLTTPALRAHAARVEFAKQLDSILPRSKEILKKKMTQILPEPVE